MKTRTIVAVLCIGALLGLLETTLGSFLPWPFGLVQPILISLIFYVMVAQKPFIAVLLGIGAGLMRDIFSVHGSLFFLGIFPAIAWLCQLIASRILTNRSLYSTLAMLGAARLFTWLWIGFCLRLLLRQEAFWTTIEWSQLLSMVIADMVVMSGLFLLSTFMGHRFVSVRLSARDRYEI